MIRCCAALQLLLVCLEPSILTKGPGPQVIAHCQEVEHLSGLTEAPAAAGGPVFYVGACL